MVVQGHLALGVLLRLEVEEGADHAEQDDGRGLGSNSVRFLLTFLFCLISIECVNTEANIHSFKISIRVGGKSF